VGAAAALHRRGNTLHCQRQQRGCLVTWGGWKLMPFFFFFVWRNPLVELFFCGNQRMENDSSLRSTKKTKKGKEFKLETTRGTSASPKNDNPQFKRTRETTQST
jgi:hypothetical protein